MKPGGSSLRREAKRLEDSREHEGRRCLFAKLLALLCWVLLRRKKTTGRACQVKQVPVQLAFHSSVPPWTLPLTTALSPQISTLLAPAGFWAQDKLFPLLGRAFLESVFGKPLLHSQCVSPIFDRGLITSIFTTPELGEMEKGSGLDIITMPCVHV